MMYISTTVPHPHGHWQLQELNWESCTPLNSSAGRPLGKEQEITLQLSEKKRKKVCIYHPSLFDSTRTHLHLMATAAFCIVQHQQH